MLTHVLIPQAVGRGRRASAKGSRRTPAVGVVPQVVEPTPPTPPDRFPYSPIFRPPEKSQHQSKTGTRNPGVRQNRGVGTMSRLLEKGRRDKTTTHLVLLKQSRGPGFSQRRSLNRLDIPIHTSS